MRSRQRKTYRRKEENCTSPSAPPPQPNRQGFRQGVGVGGGSAEVQQLMRENSELRRQLVELKVHQFYQLDGDKLKELIREVETLRKEVKELKSTVNELQLQNDFLLRTNQHLKQELQREIEARTKVKPEHRGSSKPHEATRITDTSHNTEDSISHLSSPNSQLHTLNSNTLDEVLRDSARADEYDMEGRRGGRGGQTRERGEMKESRKSLMQKILSPRRGRESSGEREGNEYLLYRRREKQTLSKIE